MEPFITLNQIKIKIIFCHGSLKIYNARFTLYLLNWWQ